MQMSVKSQFCDPKVEVPSLLTASDRDEATRYMQERIDHHEDIIRYYKRHMNGATFTCRLPPEILGIIFNEVRHHQTLDSRAIRWIRAVTHVCSYWRYVALHTPSLWTNIPLINPAWAKEMIIRSKSATLTIKHDASVAIGYASPVTLFPLLKAILENHMSRIGTLSLISIHHVDLCALLDQPAPTLKSLQLSMQSPKTLNLPPIILQTSQLQSLTLSGCCMDWDPQLSDLQHLRFLKISNLPDASAPTVTQLLGILATTPHLTEFTFDSYFRQSQSLGVNNGAAKPIKLNHLRKISVAHDFSSCALLLDNISFPKDVSQISFNMRFLPLEDHGDLNPIEKMARRLDESIDYPLLKLIMGNMFVRGWNDADTAYKPHSQPTISLSFSTDHSRATSSAIGKAICRSFNMNDLSILTVSLDIDEDTWSIFSRLPELETLVVTQSLSGFYAALRGQGDTTTVSSTFPRLLEVTLSQCDLEETVLDDAGKHIGIVTAFATSFKQRKDAGLAFQQFRIEGCTGVDSDELDRLANVVNLDWDETGDIDSVDPEDDYYNDPYDEDYLMDDDDYDEGLYGFPFFDYPF